LTARPYSGRHRSRVTARLARCLNRGVMAPLTTAAVLATATTAPLLAAATSAERTSDAVLAPVSSTAAAKAVQEGEHREDARQEELKAALARARAQQATRDRQRRALAQKKAADAKRAQAQRRQAEAKAKAAQARNAALAAQAEARRQAARAWVSPIEGAVFTSGFGYRWGRMHQGDDFAAPVGTPLVAMSAGVVISAGMQGGYGNAIEIRYTDGTVSVYAHLDNITASVGQRVTSGELVGRTGNTGRSTGPHLHLEIHPGGGAPVDPSAWLSAKGVQG
jgi:murein DD-endopeptidase MepM/ murein hydrolase activator NlpD